MKIRYVLNLRANYTEKYKKFIVTVPILFLFFLSGCDQLIL
ncbi:hypothetical protein GW12_11830 [Acinetobacter sp. HR7]|nr:hypothetical protein GW12_11830 [Acinetobacter sp. HR7]